MDLFRTSSLRKAVYKPYVSNCETFLSHIRDFLNENCPSGSLYFTALQREVVDVQPFGRSPNSYKHSIMSEYVIDGFCIFKTSTN